MICNGDPRLFIGNRLFVGSRVAIPEQKIKASSDNAPGKTKESVRLLWQREVTAPPSLADQQIEGKISYETEELKKEYRETCE